MKTTTKTIIILELSMLEAEWLAAVMQNPLYGETPEEEDENNARFRHKLFDALTKWLTP